MGTVLITLADLELSHNGPPPPGAVDAILLGGPERRERLRLRAARGLHERLAREARLGIARRRAVVRRPDAAAADPWLGRLCRTLAAHRHAAAGARQDPCAKSQ